MSGAVLESGSPVHRFVLLTDIAHSSRLAEQYPREYMAALARHNHLVEDATERRGGLAYKQVGDGYFVLFETAGACLGAASELGAAFGSIEPLAEDAPVQVRIALHAGTLQPSGKEYYGPALNRVSRICQVCNPGQVLLSGALVADSSGNEGKTRKSVLPDLEDIDSGLRLRDLGLHHLRDLAEPEQLFQLDCDSFGRHEFPPLATLENRPNNLVSQPNRFIGRERELTELAEILTGDTHLASIVAPGGYGKSRLAAQLCANLLNRFDNGVFMVYLAPVRESLSVPTAIASALSLQFSGGGTPEQQLCAYLRGKELLLCLDNFEHLPDSAPLVSQLLAAAPRLKVLITSREPLRIQGEQTFGLEPLPVAAGSGQFSEAELLFADRAAMVNRGFALTPQNSAEISHFCEHMAGIPLAIEMAAAWMDSFTLAELHDELTHQLELEARTSDLPQRHQSLKASLDWSWELLGEEQQANLMKLSTFRGGFFSEAAGAVLNLKGMALRSVLALLCDKSWLYTREVNGQTRFFMRDMLAHEYALAKLEATRSDEDSLFETAVSAHAAYYAELAEREGPRQSGGGKPDGGAAQMQSLHTWGTELENFNEALDTTLNRGVFDRLLPITNHLLHFLSISNQYFQMHDRCRQLLAEAQALDCAELEILAQYGLSEASVRLGRIAESQDASNEVLALAHAIGDQRWETRGLTAVANVRSAQGDHSGAIELLNQALSNCLQSGHHHDRILALANLALIHSSQGDYERAAEIHREVLEFHRQNGDRLGEAAAASNLAAINWRQGNFRGAAELESQSLALYREIGNWQGIAGCLSNLGAIERDLGIDYAKIRERFVEALSINRNLGHRAFQAINLGNIGILDLLQGDYSAAEEPLTEALALGREINFRVLEASTLSVLAILHHSREDYAHAAELCSQSLVIFREVGDAPGICSSCATASPTFAAVGALRQAAIALCGGEARSAEVGHHFEPEIRIPIDEAHARLDSAVAAGEISAEQFAAWKAEGEKMDSDELADFVQIELEKVKGSTEKGSTGG